MKTLGKLIYWVSFWSFVLGVASLAGIGVSRVVELAHPAEPESCLAPLDATLVSVAVVRLENRHGHLYADLELADSESERLESVYAGQAVNGLYRLRLPLHVRTLRQTWTYSGRNVQPWDTWPALRTQVLNAIQEARGHTQPQ